MHRSTASSFRKPSSEASALRRAGMVTASVLLGTSLIIPGVVSSAQAATACPAGSTTLSSGACEVTFTSSPSSAWTPPVGISKLHALLVGAGGVGNTAPPGYGGGGGGVEVITLATSGAVTISVGTPGTAGYSSSNDTTVTQAGTTTTAFGGRPATSSSAGASGSGISPNGRSGAGAGDAGDPGGNGLAGRGGAGLVVNEIDGASSTLFTDDTDCLGGGGGQRDSSATCGGGYAPDETSATGEAPVGNSGGGGGVWYNDLGYHVHNGADGFVALRFDAPALPDTPLPDTGVTSSAPWVMSALGLLAAGSAAALGALSLRLRRR
jgi:hypothetical protein